MHSADLHTWEFVRKLLPNPSLNWERISKRFSIHHRFGVGNPWFDRDWGLRLPKLFSIERSQIQDPKKSSSVYIFQNPTQHFALSSVRPECEKSLDETISWFSPYKSQSKAKICPINSHWQSVPKCSGKISWSIGMWASWQKWNLLWAYGIGQRMIWISLRKPKANFSIMNGYLRGRLTDDGGAKELLATIRGD